MDFYLLSLAILCIHAHHAIRHARLTQRPIQSFPADHVDMQWMETSRNAGMRTPGMEATRHTGMETLGTLGWTLQRHWDGDIRDIKVEAPGKLEDTEIETSRDAEMETIRDTGQRPLGILRERHPTDTGIENSRGSGMETSWDRYPLKTIPSCYLQPEQEHKTSLHNTLMCSVASHIP